MREMKVTDDELHVPEITRIHSHFLLEKCHHGLYRVSLIVSVIGSTLT